MNGLLSPRREVRDRLLDGWVSAVTPEGKITDETLSYLLSSRQTTTLEVPLQSNSKV